MKITHKIAAIFSVAICLSLCRAAATPAQNSAVAADFSMAVCPIAYPLDQNSSQRGVHYIFYGNGFFINQQGYLLTAAHVLSQLTDGGQPFVLLRSKNAPPKLVKAELIAVDTEHDVAVLRVTPNPFEGKFSVSVLQLAAEKPVRGQRVSAEALRPSRLKDPHSFDAPVEDRAPGELLESTSTQLEKGKPQSELFLFSHEVLRGQIGAPVVLEGTGQVVGFVEGRWLHPGVSLAVAPAAAQTRTLGAAVPIQFAIQLLEQKGIAWEKSTALSPPSSF
jgi:hypothetical protein